MLGGQESLIGAEGRLHRCRRASSSVPEGGFIGAGLQK